MLFPRFTIRWLLRLTTVSAVFFLVVSRAVRGEAWAISLAAAVAGVILAFAMYGLFFGFAFILAAMPGVLRGPRPVGGSPFATAAPPPQILPPQEPDTF